MGISKKNLFSEEDNSLANYSDALGHPARVSIVKYIKAHPGKIANDIVKVIPLSYSSVIRHIQVLTESGLIESRLGEKFNHLFPSDTAFDKMKDLLSGL